MCVLLLAWCVGNVGVLKACLLKMLVEATKRSCSCLRYVRVFHKYWPKTRDSQTERLTEVRGAGSLIAKATVSK